MPRCHQFDKSCSFDVRINFSRRDIGVPQHRLKRAKISAAFEQMRCKGVAQDMRADSLGRNSCLCCKRAEELKQTHAAQML